MPRPILYLKHRPHVFEDYIWPSEALRQKAQQWVDEGSVPHLMFTGPPGTGKTSLALLLIHCIGVDRRDVLMIDGSTHNNADTVRSDILTFCQSGGWEGLKIVFIDEFDRFTGAAQEMLRGLIEQYSSIVRFILTANYRRRIITPLHSRFEEIELDGLDREAFATKLIEVVFKEGCKVDDTAFDTISQITEAYIPDLRKAITVLARHLDAGAVKPYASKSSYRWETDLTNILKTGSDPDSAHAFIAGLHEDEIELIYKYLYEQSSMFGVSEKDAILIIANGAFRHDMSAFKGIMLMETIIRLGELEVK